MPGIKQPPEVIALRNRRRRKEMQEFTSREPTPPLTKPPPGLPAPVAAAWDEIVASVEPGLLQTADALFMEAFAHLLARCRAEGFESSRRATLLHAFRRKLKVRPARPRKP